MTPNLPDYSAHETPDGKPLDEYTHHERRSALFRLTVEAGSPFAISQTRIADRFDVHRSTICRDMDRLRESIDDSLGDDAKLTTRALYERVTTDLLAEDDWRASREAFKTAMDWNEWLAAIGEQEREPRRSELDVEMRSRHSEVSYRIVREGDEDDPLPTVDNAEGVSVDYEGLGFTSGPENSDE